MEKFRSLQDRLRRAGGAGLAGASPRRPARAGTMPSLADTGLGAFLFSAIGRDVNGSDVTVLSMLARLNKDPWVEAASLADVSRPVASARLASDIAQMPLTDDALSAAPARATVLVDLLPRRVATGEKPAVLRDRASTRAGLMTIFVALAVILALAAPLLGRGTGHPSPAPSPPAHRTLAK